VLNRFSVVICGLLLLTACQQQPTTDPLAYGPDVNTLVVTDLSADLSGVAQAKSEALAKADDFIAKAIAVTGGYEAWINAKKLELDCVVTFYEPTRLLVEDKSGGGFYLTQQHHEVYPWSNSVRISAIEPQGKFVSLLSQDNFTSAQGQARYDIRNLVYAVRAIMTAPVRLLDKSVEFSKPSEPVKIQGLWYYPIQCSSPVSRIAPDGTREVVFYQNRDTALIDIVSFVGEKESLLVRGYDYRQVKETGVLLPTRIEVFAATPAGVIQHRLLKIDYYNLW
jgi:hypothetical protein